ncbi:MULTISPECIES: 50S ribosomal protein L11 methyltransferase [unclassified Rhizobium]|uniref:50S ribosomal protein L11 methyltransferase n=1 Tax=unclassified Rhizobium TaxID=2613769 RepID=UPI001ADBE3B4|nr:MULTISPECIES: 50S ribosomal protein L11 methyltransferase [unclassified Rhizobium]MBO9098865.1 50S ribosomal protein L11 methyltransferase [Rhizobium sp. L58/93]MBO9132330.1 50S ribosomal protein L11 methyltransferase [Rhizobium sp. B209b/85]MBO9169130.1 50S ribosomal protein L11 methyltransferase [Rhizobium sp. L245/93]MBO9185081.1 50S ribosomal protein L11 methyltransferase [Rhizobium sp. E27B/91]QXZ85229.1 50S ribosomal protein L11 methyltransferase [Rhizobium sp. K1/93]
MNEIRLYVTTTERDAERILDLMTPVFEDEELPIATSEIDEKKDIWEASIYLYADQEEDVRPRFEALLAEAYPGLAIDKEIIPDVDWIARSLDGLKPVRAGRFVVHGSHDRDKIRASEIAIEIDAGQAFGTGHHGTTAGCLETIEMVMRSRRVRNALDLGTGSGVLAIAVRKLKNIPVLATDIDPIAVRVARENVVRNGIASGISLETAPGFHSTAFSRHGPFDLIIANILARPLIRMAPQLANHLAPGGSVILSGILAAQRWKVIAAYNGARLRHVRTIWRNGWVTIHLDRG